MKISNKLSNSQGAFIFIIFCFCLCFSSCHSSKEQGTKNHTKEYSLNMKGMTNMQKKLVAEAMEWMGTPYSYGACDKGKGTDCSGMVLAVYRDAAGVMLPRNSAKQAEFSKKIHKCDVKIGDLVFFATGHDPKKISHVGIMIDNQNFIHASSSKGVVISSVDAPYYIRTFMGYGRVL